MRLDLFLKLSRLCPQRTLAQKLCDAGLVLVNGRAAKPSHAVKAGDDIIIRRRDVETTVRVLTVPPNRNVSRNEAHSLIEILHRRELEA